MTSGIFLETMHSNYLNAFMASGRNVYTNIEITLFDVISINLISQLISHNQNTKYRNIFFMEDNKSVLYPINIDPFSYSNDVPLL